MACIYARTIPVRQYGAYFATWECVFTRTYAVGYDAIGKRLIAAAKYNGAALRQAA